MSRGAMPRQFQLLAAAVFGLVAVLFAYGAWDRAERGPIIISSDPTLLSIVVEIRGEVIRPGVYSLPGDGRLGQLIELAGGPTAGADLRQVSLARRLRDEELVVIPATARASPVASPTTGSELPIGIETDGRLNVNSASAPELETLPGIGEVLAERIVAYREVNGPFARVEDLTSVEGISESLVDELRDLVTVGP